MRAILEDGDERREILGHGMLDAFLDDRPKGSVVGSSCASGARRGGRDLEGQIAIDDGALRFQPLVRPGWGRQAIAYGPHLRTPGLAFAAAVLNGHNSSQSTALNETLRRRLWQWAKGNGAAPLWQRAVRWPRSMQRRWFVRRLQQWWVARPGAFVGPDLNENLAVGWFAEEAPADPLVAGNAFVMHAAEGENGELRARVARRGLKAFRRVQNVPIYYAVVLRETGAAYYAASVPGAHALAPLPSMRPVAIDPFGDDAVLYPGLQQAVLGQIGFRVDTRVYGACVAQLPELAPWYGTAHAADRLVGRGELGRRPAEVGGLWTVSAGGFVLDNLGARALERDSRATLDPGAASGLVHALVRATAAGDGIGLFWRGTSAGECWSLLLSTEGCELGHTVGGRRVTISRDRDRRLVPGRTHSVQILDDGLWFGLHLDGELLFDRRFKDARLAQAHGIGLFAANSSACAVKHFEAHPRQVPIPPAIRLDLPWIAPGEIPVVQETFEGPRADLHGKVSTTGGCTWARTFGRGSFELSGERSARVATGPSAGRTLYTLPWSDPKFADVEVTIRPPGHQRGIGENCRVGLVLWQDARNYVTPSFYLDDNYSGASLAMFSCIDGYEELYDAVWTMLWTKIWWGRDVSLRARTDGNSLLLCVDNEPVLSRALTDIYPGCHPLTINRVGIAVNWEWGVDSGSSFSNFICRGRRQWA